MFLVDAGGLIIFSEKITLVDITDICQHVTEHIKIIF